MELNSVSKQLRSSGRRAYREYVPGDFIYPELVAAVAEADRVRGEGSTDERERDRIVEVVAEQSKVGDLVARPLKTPLKNEARPLVFLCHASSDKLVVRDLYRRLIADGIRCWFDEKSLRPGDNWEYEIEKAIRRSQYVLACLSRESVTRRGYVQKEIARALDVAEEQPEGVAFIIPVKLEECEVPDRLRKWHWSSLFMEGAYERLVDTLKSPDVEGPSSNI